MSTELTIGYQPETTHYGSIDVAVNGKGFSGLTYCVTYTNALHDFVVAIAEYPLNQLVKLSINTCISRSCLPDAVQAIITVAASNGRGGLRVDIELRDVDHQRVVITYLYIVYSDLEIFRLALQSAIISGGEAVLKGEDDPF